MKLFAVIGLGQFGSTVAQKLSDSGCEVMAIDRDEDRIEQIKNRVAKSVRVDASDRPSLAAMGISDVDTAVVAVGEDFESSVLITSHLRHLGVGWITVRANNDVQGNILELVGANEVVYPEVQMATQVARALASPNILKQFEVSENLHVAELRPPPETIGKPIRELNLRATYNVNIITIRRREAYQDEHGETRYRMKDELVGPGDVIQKDHLLVVVGTEDSIAHFSGGEQP